MNFKNILFILLTIPLHLLVAQEEFPIWKNGIPGQIPNSEVTEYNTGALKSDEILRVHQVTTPTLKAFWAPNKQTKNPAVLICPGGGYKILAIDHEGYQIAEWLTSIGITAFVLKYRLPDDRIMTNKKIGPLQDAQKALRIIRENASQWNIDSDQIGVMGFSAGGHLAASLSVHYNDEVYPESKSISARPNFSILMYPVISFQKEITHAGSRKNLIGDNPSQEDIDYFSNELQIDKNTPPTLLIHSVDDKAVPIENSLRYFEKLKQFSISAELHAFTDGGHGYGLGTRGTNTMWSKNAEIWLSELLKK
jgi:acetyl esterase/lipase